MTINHSFGLNLSILSFDLPVNLVKESDDIRVSITTLPEKNKQAFTVPARKMKNPYLNFSFNVMIPSENIPKDFISTGTEKVIIIFRKKSFFQSDPIIAYTSIFVNEFPKKISEPIQMKTVAIYKSTQKEEMISKNNNYNSNYKQNTDSNKNGTRICGKMNIKMTLTDPFKLEKFDDDQLLDIDSNSSFQFGKCSFGFKKLKI